MDVLENELPFEVASADIGNEIVALFNSDTTNLEITTTYDDSSGAVTTPVTGVSLEQDVFGYYLRLIMGSGYQSGGGLSNRYNPSADIEMTFVNNVLADGIIAQGGRAGNFVVGNTEIGVKGAVERIDGVGSGVTISTTSGISTTNQNILSQIHADIPEVLNNAARISRLEGGGSGTGGGHVHTAGTFGFYPFPGVSSTSYANPNANANIGWTSQQGVWLEDVNADTQVTPNTAVEKATYWDPNNGRWNRLGDSNVRFSSGQTMVTASNSPGLFNALERMFKGTVGSNGDGVIFDNNGSNLYYQLSGNDYFNTTYVREAEGLIYTECILSIGTDQHNIGLRRVAPFHGSVASVEAFANSARDTNAARYEITNGTYPWDLDLGISTYQVFWLHRAQERSDRLRPSLLDRTFYTTERGSNIANGFPLKYGNPNIDNQNTDNLRFRIYLPVEEIDEIYGSTADVTDRHDEPRGRTPNSYPTSGSRFTISGIQLSQTPDGIDGTSSVAELRAAISVGDPTSSANNTVNTGVINSGSGQVES